MEKAGKGQAQSNDASGSAQNSILDATAIPTSVAVHVPRTRHSMLTFMTNHAACVHSVMTILQNPGNIHPTTAGCAHLHEVVCIIQWRIILVVV